MLGYSDMRINLRCLGLAVFFILVSQRSGLAQQAGDRRQVEGLIAKYAQSIDAADTALASQLWSQSPEVSFIHPRGSERGFDQVKQNVYVGTMGALFSERKLRVSNVRVHIYGDAAWAEFDWDFAAKMKKDGSAVNTKGRETQIYRKEESGWRLVHVHYSSMPVSGERQGF